jgi:LemA protein
MGKYILGCLGVAVIGIILLVIVALVGGVGSYNHLVGLKQNVNSTWAEVENQYQRRDDLIGNLVKTVQGAADFEKSTLIAVTQARASVGQVKLDPSQAPTSQAQLDQFQAAQGQLGNALSRLLVVSEKYPDLKSNQNFLDLQTQLEGTENRITTARYGFNQAAQGYNTAVQTFPTVLYAAMLGFTQRPYFQAEPGAEKAPDVNFNFNNSTNAAPAK